MAVWALDPGVVTLPSGRRFRCRALRSKVPLELEPQFGVYLVAREPSGLQWPYRWVRCPDFRVPSDRDAAVETLRDAYTRAGTERVEIGCTGGVGRTGIGLAMLAILDGVDPADAVDWVRRNYHRRAVETPWQRRWVESLEIR